MLLGRPKMIHPELDGQSRAETKGMCERLASSVCLMACRKVMGEGNLQTCRVVDLLSKGPALAAAVMVLPTVREVSYTEPMESWPRVNVLHWRVLHCWNRVWLFQLFPAFPVSR